MTDRPQLLARLATAVAEASAADSLTSRLCEAVRGILGADGASITVATGAVERVALAATDEVARHLDDLQDVLGDGPAGQAYRSAQPVVVDLRGPSGEWSGFAGSAAQRTPAVHVAAFPMRAGTGVLGVLTLYRAGDEPFSGLLEEAAFLADAVGVALLHDPASTSDLGEGGSWSNRAEIHQATGMVVAQLAVSAKDALALLRAHAFALDQNLAQVAHAVVTRELDLRTNGAP
jgi:GAF domain-containing protein